MAFNSGAKGQNRDFGLHGSGPGKGSSPRNNSSRDFRENFDGICWKGAADFSPEIHPNVTRKGNRIVKVYR